MLQKIQQLGNGIKTIDDLRAHLQLAIEIEHSTIPPYLCALYSLRTVNSIATYIVRSVVIEEMLHMTLAANVLNAIGGTPVIDKPDFCPTYPAALPDSASTIILNLQRFSRDAIETFKEIEKPQAQDAPPEADHYETLGQFYVAIEEGLNTICAGDRYFTGDTKRQVSPFSYYGGGGELIPVTNKDSALAALDTIRAQGEGVNSTIFDNDRGMFAKRYDYAHYFRFNEILKGQFYQVTDGPLDSPSGPTFLVEWDAIYPMKTNPTMKEATSDVRGKMEEFNRLYTSLLKQLDQTYNGAPDTLARSVHKMFHLRTAATSLMAIPYDDQNTWGPSFEYLPE